MKASDFLKSKTTLPSELRTKQWARVPLWIKEQSFFMAGVTDAVVLDAFRDAATQVASGETSEQEALRIIREGLKKADYKPGDGQEGTIKDLSTVRRQLTTLRANVALAGGWAQHQVQLGAREAYPASELHRASARKAPRKWEAKLWPAAVRQRNAAHPELAPLDESVMIGLVDDPVWVMLSDFGAPYDPLKYQTGMRKRPVGYIQAKALGILAHPKKKKIEQESAEGAEDQKEDEAHASDRLSTSYPPEPEGGAMRSPGETTEAQPQIASPEIKQGLERALNGMGKWEGETLVFTDPNGTRPYAPDELAPIIIRMNVDGTANYQRRALAEWLALGGDEEALAKMRTKHAGEDMLDDFNRLVWRMQMARRTETVIELLTALAAALMSLL